MTQRTSIQVSPLALVALLVVFLALSTQQAHAAGGLGAATTAATDFRTWLNTFVGVCGGAFLLYRAAMAWANKIQWIDFGMDIAKVAVAGGAIVLSGWAYSVFA